MFSYILVSSVEVGLEWYSLSYEYKFKAVHPFYYAILSNQTKLARGFESVFVGRFSTPNDEVSDISTESKNSHDVRTTTNNDVRTTTKSNTAKTTASTDAFVFPGEDVFPGEKVIIVLPEKSPPALAQEIKILATSTTESRSIGHSYLPRRY